MIEIIGKNGAGKTFIANQLYQKNFLRNVGYTTRKKREGEIDGIDYHFITEEQFAELLNNNAFIDYKYRNGAYYGISKTDLSDNTIIVSGNSNKIENATGFKVFKFYIDSDISVRYDRVKNRNDTMINLFNRFHNENYSYLTDFKAIFINNDEFNDLSLNMILEYLNKHELVKHLEDNRKFLQSKVDNFDFQELKKSNDQLLLVLKYEEYLMRKMYLEYNDPFLLQSDIAKQNYYKFMVNFLEGSKIDFDILNNSLYFNVNNENYNLDYKLKRKVR